MIGDVGYEPAGANQFELEGRLLPGQDPFGPDPKPALAGEEDEEGDEIFTFAADEVPFYEVIEVELKVPTDPRMDRNQYKFEHANGTIKTTKLPKL